MGLWLWHVLLSSLHLRNDSPTSEFHIWRKKSESVVVSMESGVKSEDSLESRASASSRALSHCAMWRVVGDAGAVEDEQREWKGSWVCGSIPMQRSRFLRWVFHKFLISLSVLPGSWEAIEAHLQRLLISKTPSNNILIFKKQSRQSILKLKTSAKGNNQLIWLASTNYLLDSRLNLEFSSKWFQWPNMG